MTDRVHPSAKTATKPTLSAAKSHISAASRPRTTQRGRRSSSSCGCTLCCCLLLIILLLVGGGGAVLYFFYHPQRPTFSLTSLKLTTLNVTTTFNANFHLTLSATNPNNKITFSYDATSVSILTGRTALAAATIPAFIHPRRNTTVIEASIATDDVATQLKRSESEVALKVELQTKVAADTGLFRTPRVGIRVLCGGACVSLPDGDKAATALTENTECKVDVRFKVWKWTLG